MLLVTLPVVVDVELPFKTSTKLPFIVDETLSFNTIVVSPPTVKSYSQSIFSSIFCALIW